MARVDTLIVVVPGARLQGDCALEYLRELDSVSARHLVLELREVRDELLPRVAAFVKYLGANRSVRVCGLAATQLSLLSALGLQSDLLRVGPWRQAGRRSLI